MKTMVKTEQPCLSRIFLAALVHIALFQSCQNRFLPAATNQEKIIKTQIKKVLFIKNLKNT